MRTASIKLYTGLVAELESVQELEVLQIEFRLVKDIEEEMEQCRKNLALKRSVVINVDLPSAQETRTMMPVLED